MDRVDIICLVSYILSTMGYVLGWSIFNIVICLYVFKTLPMVILSVRILVYMRLFGYSRCTILLFVFTLWALCGDVVLMVTDGIMIGLGPFIMARLLLVLATITHPREDELTWAEFYFTTFNVLISVIATILSLTYGIGISVYYDKYIAGAIVYTIVAIANFVVAACRLNTYTDDDRVIIYALVIGIILFNISDGLLLYSNVASKWVSSGIDLSQVAVMLTYWTGMGLISVYLRRENNHIGIEHYDVLDI